MTELEKMAYTKAFVDKLAEGINPMTDSPIPAGELLHQPRVAGCMKYLSELLDTVIRNGGIGKVERTRPFTIHPARLADFRYAPVPVPAREITRRLDDLTGDPLMKSLSVQAINRWLLAAGYLYTDTADPQNPRKLPTEAGRRLGLLTEQKLGRDGEYTAVLFNESAQRYVVAHLFDIMREA